MLPDKKSSKKDFSVTFYVFGLPVLLLLIGVFAVSALASSRITSQRLSAISKEGSVLSKGSGGEGDDDKEDDEGEDNDSGRDSDNDDDNNDESDSGPGSKNDSSSKPAKIESSSNNKSEERVVNDDGTVSVVKTKEKDGRLKYEVKTYDTSGNKISVEKYESKDGEEKSRVSAYDELGNKISDVRLETEDGKEVELRVKEGGTELSRVRFDVEKQELVVKSESDDASEDESAENKLRIRLDGNNFLLTRQGVDALSKFPLTVDDASGAIFVQTPVGEVRLGVMPDTIVEKAKASDDIDDVSGVELESNNASVNTSDAAPLEFKLAGTKSAKLLGLFNLQIPSTVVYDAQTGSFLRSERAFVTRVLDLFSF